MTTTTQTPQPVRQQPRSYRSLIVYGGTVLIVLVVALVADWGRIGRNFFQPDVIRDMFPQVITIAAKNTLLYTSFAFAFGFILALVLALMRRSAFPQFRWVALVYIELFRAIPALITILLVGFGLPIAFPGLRIPGGILGQGTVGLGLVAAAYMAETIRAGIEAVPRGQMEAARSLGMPRGTALTYIVLPQAFRIIIPPLTNELVLLIKDTSLLFVLGTTPVTKELTKFARDFQTSSQNATPLTVAAFVYVLITLPLTFLVRRLEKRAAESKR